MSNNEMIKYSARNAFGVLIYVSGVGALMVHGTRLIGPMDKYPLLGMVAFLMLFLVSALVTGLLVLGKPAALYLDGQREEAVRLLFYIAGWLVAMTVVALLGLAFARAVTA